MTNFFRMPFTLKFRTVRTVPLVLCYRRYRCWCCYEMSGALDRLYLSSLGNKSQEVNSWPWSWPDVRQNLVSIFKQNPKNVLSEGIESKLILTLKEKWLLVDLYLNSNMKGFKLTCLKNPCIGEITGSCDFFLRIIGYDSHIGMCR